MLKFQVDYFNDIVGGLETWLERIFITADNEDQAKRIARAYCTNNPYNQDIYMSVQEVKR